MEITTQSQIKFKLTIEENTYSFTVPHGAPIEQALKASSFFTSAMVKMKKEHDEDEEKSPSEIIEEVDKPEE